MRSKPHVIIVSRRLERKNKLVNWVSEAHLSILLKYDIIPVVVPIVEEAVAHLEYYAGFMDGMLMVEGGDVSPSYYNKIIDESSLEEIDSIKDKIEIGLFRNATDKDVPVLGICRGLQIINALHGGTLCNQDGTSCQHINYDNYDEHRHKVDLLENTPLHNWYGRKSLQVNSYHHQGIDELAPGFKPMAIAEDGLIEGIYRPESNFLVGLQFHPERMLPDYGGNIRVFEAFAAAVKGFATNKRGDK